MRFLRTIFYLVLMLGVAFWVFRSKFQGSTIKGNGHIQQTERDLSDFERVKISGNFEVILKQGNHHEVEIEADDNLHALILTEIENNTLYVSSENRLKGSDDITITITAPEYRRIRISGTVDLETEGLIESEELEVDLSGAGEANMHIEAEDLRVNMSGAGALDLDGEAERARYNISGAGQIEAFNLETETLEVEMSGAADAEVYASESLSVHVSGAGSIRYRGNPSHVSRRVSGAASIRAD